MTGKEKTEFVILQEDVKHIKKDVKQTKDDVSSINKTMNKLTSKLFNDSDTGEMGYFEVMKRNGVRLTKLENIKAIAYGVVFAVGGVVGWLFKQYGR